MKGDPNCKNEAITFVIYSLNKTNLQFKVYALVLVKVKRIKG